MPRAHKLHALSLLAVFILVLAGTTCAKRESDFVAYYAFYHYGWPYPWLHVRVEDTGLRAFYEMREPAPHRTIAQLHRIDWRAFGAAAPLSEVFAMLSWLPFFVVRREQRLNETHAA